MLYNFVFVTQYCKLNVCFNIRGCFKTETIESKSKVNYGQERKVENLLPQFVGSIINYLQ